jgi:hypothetical protein
MAAIRQTWAIPHPVSLRSPGLSREERQAHPPLPAGEGEGEGAPGSTSAHGNN